MIVVVLLIICSSLISGSEVAFFSLDKGALDPMANSKDKRERNVYSLLQHPKKLLATILILNNVVNISIITLITFATWRIYGTKELNVVAITAISIISTFLIVFFGEVLPKVYANKNALSFARKIVSSLQLFTKLLTPLSFVLTASTRFVEKRFENKYTHITTDDLNKAIEITTQASDVSDEEKGILKGIANFGNISTKQIMCARTDIDAFDVEIHFHDLMNRINKSGYSRIPIYEGTIDKVIGIMYIKDLLPFTQESEHFNWRKYIRSPYFVPENKKINELLKNFQQKRVHMAIVVDEYGGTSGLITLEDIIEEIVGDINDEFDNEEVNYTRVNEHSFVFEGKTSLNDFCRVIELDPEYFDEVKGENESLGGLMLELFSKMPHVGEKISYKAFHFTIESVNTKRVKRIMVTQHKKDAKVKKSQDAA